METKNSGLNRRAFLYRLLAGSGLGLAAWPAVLRPGLSFGALSPRQGMQKIMGDVKINTVPAQLGALVDWGDVVFTGPESYAAFVIDRSAYLVRDNTHLQLAARPPDQPGGKAVHLLRVVSGKMLSVFGRKTPSIVTATAVIGIRGTGVYVEAEAERTYVCTCYGVVDINATADPAAKETVKTTYHDAPRFVYGAGQDRLIVKAPVFNHTDAELIMLEELVWRKPPFDNEQAGGY